MADHVVHLQSKRLERAKLVQKLQHAVAGFALVGDGLSVLNAGPGRLALAIAVAEVVCGAAFLLMVARAAQVVFGVGARGRHAAVAHRGVNWIDVVAAAMLLVEVAAHWRDTGHIRRPTVLTAVVLLVLAFAHRRIEEAAHRRRVLRVTEDGVSIGGRKILEPPADAGLEPGGAHRRFER